MKDEVKGALACFLPIVMFLICEMFYDYKYFAKKPVFIGLQYLFMTILGIFVYLYIRYTTLIKIKEQLETKMIEVNSVEKNIKVYKESIFKQTHDVILFGILLFVAVLLSCVLYSKLTNNKIKGIMIFFIYSLITLATMAFKFEQIKYYKESGFKNLDNDSNIINFMMYFTEGTEDYIKDKSKEHNPTYSKKDIKSKYSSVDLSIIIPGLVFGLVFGFIDNAGLISGLEALDTPFSVISKLLIGSPPSDKNSLKLYNEKLEGTTSGLGNLFSDGLGVTLGAFFGNLAKTLFPSKISQPIWVDMVGVSLGCILGIVIPITLKNLVSGAIIKDGLLSFTFIKDLVVLSVLFAGLIALCILIPKKASEDIKGV